MGIKSSASCAVMKQTGSLLLVLAVLAACTSTGSRTSSSSSPSTSSGGYYKVGNPYEVKGNWYTPQEDYSYDETGIASWYGQEFHGGKTANGEEFNKNELTAAHKTLPLPTLARVTNLDNGRSIVVRINDRGPFSGSRLIDVSQRAAQLLGFEQNGTAKVRLQVLSDESKSIADAMRHYGTSQPTQVVQNVTTQEIVPEQMASANGLQPTPVLAMPQGRTCRAVLCGRRRGGQIAGTNQNHASHSSATLEYATGGRSRAITSQRRASDLCAGWRLHQSG